MKLKSKKKFHWCLVKGKDCWVKDEASELCAECIHYKYNFGNKRIK